MIKHAFLILAAVLWVQFSVAGPASTGKPESTGALRTVVIDAGHGGHDPGAVAAGVREKDLVLDIALRLGRKIKEDYPDVKIIYTREKDVFIPLHQRASTANRNKADLFISLHANWVSSPSANGTETFTLGLHRSQENLEVAKKENSVILLEEDYTTNYQGFDPQEAESYIMFESMQSEYQGQSIDLAAKIQEQFDRNLTLTNRGVKQAGFLVLRQASMPSVLVEIGFISNANERKFLTSENGKEKVTQSILNAFSNYKKLIDSRSRFNIAQNTTPAETVPVTTVNQAANNRQPAPQPEQNSNSGQSASTANVQAKWYAVQIAAVQRVIKTTPANFKGEKNVTRLQAGNINKYVAGRFATYNEAARERDRLKHKYPDSFVVIVQNGIPTLAKN